jgi:hypothetical protein
VRTVFYVLLVRGAHPTRFGKEHMTRQSEQLMEALSLVEVFIISMDRMGSAKALHPEFEIESELYEFMKKNIKKLSKVQRILGNIFEEIDPNYLDVIDENSVDEAEMGYWS